MKDSIKKDLEKQHYRLAGEHSAVKVCGWTKKAIRGEGPCYKQVFYGIKSHQCMQMTTSLACANRCIFCWRDYKAPVQKEWHGMIDEPELILKQSLEGQEKLLQGYKGWEKTVRNLFQESKEVRHVALSLTGEPITYPKLNKLIDLFHKNKVSTFLVTNGQYPDRIKELKPITQLYLSVDAPDKEAMKEIDKPLFSDYWKRFQKSLEYLKKKKSRTALRLTLIKGMNMDDPKKYIDIIKKADPDFIEVKGYMFIGESRQRLKKEDMPFHEEVVDFSKQLEKLLPDYGIVAEQILSRVVLLAKKDFKNNGKWHTWIDFDKFFKIIESKKVPKADDYSKPTPKTGLSGKGTKERIGSYKKKTKKKSEKQSKQPHQ